jgi:hypothetical protein
MEILLAVFGLILLLALAAFCLFGFLATFEPTAKGTHQKDDAQHDSGYDGAVTVIW